MIAEVDAICNRVDIANKTLDDIVKGRIVKPSIGNLRKRVTFVIARKWASWYPTYFKTVGGCYALLTRDRTSDLKKNAGVIVIDPGMHFGENLRKYFNIEPHDIRSVIVSHYHPDHTAGLLELLTLTKESQHPCSYYLNETAYEAFKAFQGEYNNILELAKGQVIKLADYPHAFGVNPFASPKTDHRDKITAKVLKTFHKEIGERHRSLGFALDIRTVDTRRRVGILGDTDGNEKYLDTYLDYLKDVDIAVIHLGAFTNKQDGKGNKHLYKRGLVNLLNCIKCTKESTTFVEEGRLKKCLDEGKIRKTTGGKIRKVKDADSCRCHELGFFKNLKLVLVSELGLEMASMDNLLQSIEGLHWSTRSFPIILYAKFFNKGDDYVKTFLKETREIKLRKEEKLEVHNTLLGTTAMKTMAYLGKIDSIELEDAVELYHASIFLGAFILYLTIGEISDATWMALLPRRLKRRLKHLSKSQKLESLFKTLDKLITPKNLIADKVSYEGFLEMFNAKHEIITQFGDTLKNFLKELLISVDGFTPRQMQRSISDFSETIFYSVRKVSSATSSTGSSYRESGVNEYLSFIQSISIFDLNTLKLIHSYLARKRDLTPLVLLLSYELSRQVKRLLNDEGTNIRKARAKRNRKKNTVMKGILDILHNYSKEGGVKFLLSDIGLQLDLSSRDLMIRKGKGSWVSVNMVEQEFDPKEGLKLK